MNDREQFLLETLACIEAQNKEILALLQKKKRKPRDKVEFVPPDFVDREIWDMYLKLRKEKGAAMKPTTFTLIVKKMVEWNKHGHDVDEILKRTIANGWTGLFEIKSNGKSNYVSPEVSSPSHEPADFSRDLENSLDTSTNPYADLTGE